jgi:hypothetical protein
MRGIVRDAFIGFTEPLEGLMRHMYLDVGKGPPDYKDPLVTTGIGNLIDPAGAAIILPWKRPDGTPAGRDEILAEWMRVKNDPHAAAAGWRYALTITALRLDLPDVMDLVFRKLDQNDALLIRRFPDFESWPADAQLGAHSMAWACGPAFAFPRLAFALRGRDWLLAAQECHIDDSHNPGVRPRNVANRTLFRNAGLGKDPAVLYWPRDLGAEDDTHPDIRLDLVESEPPPAIVNERVLYIMPDPAGRKLPTYDEEWKDEDDDEPPPRAA